MARKTGKGVASTGCGSLETCMGCGIGLRVGDCHWRGLGGVCCGKCAPVVRTPSGEWVVVGDAVVTYRHQEKGFRRIGYLVRVRSKVRNGVVVVAVRWSDALSLIEWIAADALFIADLDLGGLKWDEVAL